jgi:hypothetical protein
MALEYKALPALTTPTNADGVWLDISAFSTLSIQVNQTTGGGISWAIQFSNDGSTAINYAAGVTDNEIIGASGMVRNVVGSFANANKPVPVGTRFVRVNSTGGPVSMTVCGLVDTNANRNWINRNS